MTKHKFISLTNPNWVAQSTDMMKKFGLTVVRWPDEGMAPRMIDGVKVWVTPRAEPANRALGVSKSSTHRVICECPGCGHHVSAGRLAQHNCDRRR